MTKHIHAMLAFMLIAIMCISGPVFGLYEDQAGKFDWVRRYIGSVEYMEFDQSTTPSRRLIVSTNQNVVAALSTKTGDILWRHVLENPDVAKISTLWIQDHYVSVVVGNLIRTWDVITAALREEVVLDIPLKRSESATNLYSFGKNNEELHLVEINKDNFDTRTFDTSTGAIINRKSVLGPWLKDVTRCAIAGDNLVCVDALEDGIYSLDLTSPSTKFMSKPLKSIGISEGKRQSGAGAPSSVALSKVTGSNSHLVVKIEDVKILIHVHKDGVHLSLDVTEAQAVAMDADVLFTAAQSLNSVTIQATELSTGNELVEVGLVADLPLQTGVVQSLAIHRFTRKDGGAAVRAFIGCTDHSVHLVSSTGVVWSREEALAKILAVESIDLPVSGIADAFHEHISGDAYVFSSFYFRIKSQVNHIIGWVNRVIMRSEEQDATRQSLVRDQFNIHKLMVVVTISGKVLALDTRSGEAIWSVFIPSLAPFKNEKIFLFTQRTSAHFPNNPQCVVTGRHRVTGNGLLYVFNPLTGEGVGENSGLISLTYPLMQASLLSQMDENYIKPILLIDGEIKPHVYPRSGELIILQSKLSYYVHLAVPDAPELTGYSFKDSTRGDLRLSEVWSTSLSNGGLITGVYGKRMNEKVHSQGRVLADRSVLYKYSNPNLVVVTTFGRDKLSKNTLTVHLIDTVTGAILESVVHKRVSGPFHVVHSENWIVYTSYNEKFRRHEVTTLELYEGLTQSNLTAFSSFGDKAAPPLVEKQAFILPQGVQATAHTTTEKGITTKFILFALNTGNVLQMSKWFLDPRRPMSQGVPREEGLVPYMPELPLSPQEIINHNHTLPRVSAIYTAPTGLESACLVMVYGLDVFFTRVFPSKMFDVLKDDFDHYLIIGVLLSLIIAALVTRKLAQRKALKHAWK